MSEKAKVKETMNLYSKVWQLPSFRGILLILLLANGMAAIFASVLKIFSAGTNPLETLFYYFVLFAGTSYLGAALLFLVIRKPQAPLDLRRTVGSIQFGVFFWLAISAAGSISSTLISNPEIEGRAMMFGLLVAYLFFAFLIDGLSDHHPIRNFIGAMMVPLVWYVILLVSSINTQALPNLPSNWFVISIISLIICSAAVHLIYKRVSFPFERDLGIDGPELLRAFGYEYLVDNPEPLEKTLDQISVEQDIPIEVMVIKKESGIYAIGIVLYVHPGPFRNIGSSGLPSVILDHIKEKHGVQGFVMHGTCTHHQNLPTKEEFNRVLDEIDRLIGEAPSHNEVTKLHWTEDSKFKILSLFAGQDVMAITTSAPEYTDDIALRVGMDAAIMARKRTPNVGQVAIVDAHNCISDEAVSIMPGDVEAKEYVGAVSSAIFSRSNESRHTVKAGIYQVSPKGITPKDGMGSGGIIALVLEINEQEGVLVFVDGNNVEPGYRLKVHSILKQQGFDIVEILTTDTHVVNAISMSSKGYPPVGKLKPVEILEHIGIAATKAREQLEPVSIGFSFGEVKNLRTFGEKGFETLTQNIVEAFDVAKIQGLRLGLSAFIISLLLSFLL